MRKIGYWPVVLLGCATALYQPAAGGAADSPVTTITSRLTVQRPEAEAALPTVDIYRDETIYYHADLTLGAHASDHAMHRIDYKWIEGPQKILSVGTDQVFTAGSNQTWAFVHPGHFSPGMHKVELYVDQALVDSRPFTVHAEARLTDQAERDALFAQGRDWLLKGDTDSLDREATRLRRSQARTLSGYWKLHVLYHAASVVADTTGESPEWERLQSTMSRWLSDRPESAAAVVVGAKMLVARAWAYRGGGWGRDVGADNMRRFRDLIEEARRMLDEHASTGHQDPEWDVERIVVAKAQGASPSEILARADSALQRHPLYYNIHFAAVDALLPEWGGSEEWIKRYVRMAVDRSSQWEGEQAYVRIYFDLIQDARDPLDTLNRTGAKQPEAMQGLRDLVKAYPDAYNLELARAITCLAGDAPHYRAYGSHESPALPPLAWWDTPQFRQGCDQFAFQGVIRRGTLTQQFNGFMSFFQGLGETYWQITGLVVVSLWMLSEGVVFLITRRVQRRLPPLDNSSSHPFDPAYYPRTYLISRGPAQLSNRLAIRVAVLGFAAAWSMYSIPWPDLLPTAVVFTTCLSAGISGIALVVLRLSSRLTLDPDGLQVRTLWNHRTLARYEIRGRGPVPRDAQPLMLYLSTGAALQIGPVIDADAALWAWFRTLPEKTPGITAQTLGGATQWKNPYLQ